MEDGWVGLGDRVGLDAGLDVFDFDEGLDVGPPVPVGLRGEEVELALDAVGQIVREAVGVAEARVGIPGAQAGVDLFLVVFSEEGGFQAVAQARAECGDLEVLEADVEAVLLALGGDDGHGMA